MSVFPSTLVKPESKLETPVGSFTGELLPTVDIWTFLKLPSRTKMIGPFFRLSQMLKKDFFGLFSQNLS